MKRTRKRKLRAGTVAWAKMRRRAARIADMGGYTSDPWVRTINDQAKANRGRVEPEREFVVKVRRTR